MPVAVKKFVGQLPPLLARCLREPNYGISLTEPNCNGEVEFAVTTSGDVA